MTTLRKYYECVLSQSNTIYILTGTQCLCSSGNYVPFVAACIMFCCIIFATLPTSYLATKTRIAFDRPWQNNTLSIKHSLSLCVCFDDHYRHGQHGSKFFVPLLHVSFPDLYLLVSCLCRLDQQWTDRFEQDDFKHSHTNTHIFSRLFQYRHL